MPQPNDRDDLILDVADARQIVADMGLRRALVYARSRRWFAGTSPPWAPSTGRGVGFPVDVELPILPTPSVRDLSVRQVLASGGRFQSGDVQIDKIVPRRDPNTGVELAPFTDPTEHPNEERHILLVSKSGTPWHVREGTDRLLVSAPVDEAGAVACANALRAAYPGHWSDAYAHNAASASPAPGTPATDFASALVLANALRAAWVAHRADLGAHPSADLSPVTAAVATTSQTTLVLLHNLLRVFNEHVALGPVSECVMVVVLDRKAFTHELVVRPTRRTP